MIRAVLFDAVGTLIYPNPPAAEAYFAVGRRHGSSLSVTEIRERLPAAIRAADRPAGATSLDREPTSHAAERRRWQQVVATVFDDTEHGGPLFDELWQHFANSDHWSVFDDTAETWCQLQKAGLTVGIASNFDDRLLNVCRGLKPLRQCRNIFYSAAIGFPKPSREFFARVQQQLNLAADEILLVGDDELNDHRGARAAGWHSVLIDRKTMSRTAISQVVREIVAATCRSPAP